MHRIALPRFAFVAILLMLSGTTLLAAQEQEAGPMDLPIVSEGLGAGGWYFEGKKIELGQGLALERQLDSADSISLMEFMYGLAFQFGEKESAAEAGKSLAELYIQQNRLELGRDILQQWLADFGPDWEIYRRLLDVTSSLGDFKSGLALVAEIRKVLPQAAKKNASELNWLEYSSRASLNDFTWTTTAAPLLNLASIDSWNAKSLRLYAESPGLSPDIAEQALLRADFAQKKYDEAIGHAWNLADSLRAGPIPRVFISETGKAFLNAGQFEDGLHFFAGYFIAGPAQPDSSSGQVQGAGRGTVDIGALQDAIKTTMTPSEGKPEQRLWVAAYYVARLLLASEKSNEAGIIFLELSDVAPSSADADGALWYWLDITMRQIEANSYDDFSGEAEDEPATTDPATAPLVEAHRSLEIAALTEASLHWKDAAYFDDILEAYIRRILKEKTWDDVQSLLTLIGEKTSSGLRTKLLYISGRLLEEGLAGRDQDKDARKSVASGFFQEMLEAPYTEEYYRTMASWRLGKMPPFLESMPDLSPKPGNGNADDNGGGNGNSDAAATTDAGNNKAVILPAEMSLVQDYLTFDLDDLASKTALTYLGSIDKYTIANLAATLENKGQYYPALRLARDALSRGAEDRYPELYGIVYPKAWNEAVAKNASQQGIPEALAYGIIRSESVFNPEAVSYSGAVGLTQLMPATAAETASGLKMTNYSLTNPDDNLQIGFTYYGYMLARFGGKPMRAMFAYNAGPSRMKAWDTESGELPDDILLEALHIAQTRQYGKNIIQATLAYGKIHYSIEPEALLDYLVYGIPLTKPETQPTTPITTTDTTMPAPAAPQAGAE
ncbi:MAG: lytic transglycosylase domain-containing protein [Spirochaetaceae bacterium]|nr:lytic transglycosylase domain-containing protein [Spirochaetaceae bacterium]